MLSRILVLVIPHNKLNLSLLVNNRLNKLGGFMVSGMTQEQPELNNNDADNAADIEMNLTGMKCPLPVLKARRQINQMAPSAVLKITADDPAAPLDFEHFRYTGGHLLRSSTEQAGIFTFVIAKSAG